MLSLLALAVAKPSDANNAERIESNIFEIYLDAEKIVQ